MDMAKYAYHLKSTGSGAGQRGPHRRGSVVGDKGIMVGEPVHAKEKDKA